jgi:hypothetical protein
VNGSLLAYGKYVANNSYRDEWYVKRQAVFAGGTFDYTGATIHYDESQNTNSLVDAEFHAEAWEDDFVLTPAFLKNPSAVQMQEAMLESDMIYVSGHGKYHTAYLENDVKITAGFLVGNSTVDVTNLDLSTAKLVVYDACLTASREENLCTATLEAGAECVVGWTEEIDATSAVLWQQRFQTMLRKGASVLEACDYANSFLYEFLNHAMKSVRIFGNIDLIMDPVDRLSQSQGIFPIEDGLYDTEIVFPEYSEERFRQVLAEHFDNYSTHDAWITKVDTDETGLNYVVDLHYYSNEHYVSQGYGYTAIVHNGVIEWVREQAMEEYNAGRWSLRPAIATENVPNLTQTIIDEAYEQARIDIFKIGDGVQVVEQSGYGVYNPTEDAYYYCASVVYELESGARGVHSVKYRILAEEFQ